MHGRAARALWTRLPQPLDGPVGHGRGGCPTPLASPHCGRGKEIIPVAVPVPIVGRHAGAGRRGRPGQAALQTSRRSLVQGCRIVKKATWGAGVCQSSKFDGQYFGHRFSNTYIEWVCSGGSRVPTDGGHPPPPLDAGPRAGPLRVDDPRHTKP